MLAKSIITIVLTVAFFLLTATVIMVYKDVKRNTTYKLAVQKEAIPGGGDIPLRPYLKPPKEDEYPLDEGMPPSPGWGRCPLRCFRIADPRLGLGIPVVCPAAGKNKHWCVPKDAVSETAIAGIDVRIHNGRYYYMLWPFMDMRQAHE